jgi:hypothetical protein
MKHPSIATTMRRIQRWSLKKQHEHLSELIAAEPLRSVRRIELEAAAAEIVMRDLKAGNRGLHKDQVSERQSQERVNECA